MQFNLPLTELVSNDLTGEFQNDNLKVPACLSWSVLTFLFGGDVPPASLPSV